MVFAKVHVYGFLEIVSEERGCTGLSFIRSQSEKRDTYRAPLMSDVAVDPVSLLSHWAPVCSVTPRTRSDRGQQPHFPFPLENLNPHRYSGPASQNAPLQPADPGVGSCQSLPQLALLLLDIDWWM